MRQRFCVLSFAVAMAMAMVGFDGRAQSPSAWNGVVQGAEKEGHVVIYAAMSPYVIDRLSADFHRAYPTIQAEVQHLQSGPLVARVDQERLAKADGGDIVISTDFGWFEARAGENALITPVGPASASWPAAYFDQRAIVIAALEPLVIAYNPDLVTKPPKTYQDLLDPALKGKLAVPDVVAITLVSWYAWLEKNEGGDILEKIAAQKPRIYGGTVAPAQAVASGEVAATVVTNLASVKPLIDQGAPIRYVVTRPALGIRYGLAALGWAKRPNAAQVFVDYIMSPRGQQTWSGNGDSASPLPGINGSLDPTNISTYDPKDFPPQVVAAFADRWKRIFKP